MKYAVKYHFTVFETDNLEEARTNAIERAQYIVQYGSGSLKGNGLVGYINERLVGFEITYEDIYGKHNKILTIGAKTCHKP